MKIKNPFIEHSKRYSEKHLYLDQCGAILGLNEYNNDDFWLNQNYRMLNSAYFMNYKNTVIY